MKYIVAIDWKAEFNSGFSLVALEAKNLKDAMFEAPAVAAKMGMDKVYCLRLLTQTKEQEKRLEAKDCGKRYNPLSLAWSNDEGSKWYNVWVK